jgi:hypothetical protein
MPRAIVLTSARIVSFDLHIGISKSELDNVTLLIGYIYGELLGSAGSTKGFIELDLSALIFGLRDLRELTKC